MGIGPEKLLLEAAGNWIREVSYGFQGEKISAAAMKKSARALKKIINGGNPERFVSWGPLRKRKKLHVKGWLTVAEA